MEPDKLVYMANQIGRFFAHQPREQAIASTEEHLRQFWDPRMRREIKQLVGNPQSGLDDIVRAAVEKLPKQT